MQVESKYEHSAKKGKKKKTATRDPVSKRNVISQGAFNVGMSLTQTRAFEVSWVFLKFKETVLNNVQNTILIVLQQVTNFRFTS